jgi:hypothetical protein
MGWRDVDYLSVIENHDRRSYDPSTIVYLMIYLIVCYSIVNCDVCLLYYSLHLCRRYASMMKLWYLMIVCVMDFVTDFVSDSPTDNVTDLAEYEEDCEVDYEVDCVVSTTDYVYFANHVDHLHRRYDYLTNDFDDCQICLICLIFGFHPYGRWNRLFDREVSVDFCRYDETT